MHLNGRSLLEVLTDVVHFLSEQRGQLQMNKQATSSGAVPSCAAVPGMREALLGAKGLIIIEVCVYPHMYTYVRVFIHTRIRYTYIYSLFLRR
jgi:hypothetical protein